MTEEIPAEVKIGLNLILYELFYVDSDFLKNLPPFSQKQHKYYARFDESKLNKIGGALEWALNNETYPFNSIYPRHAHFDNELIIKFLRFTLAGFVETGLYKLSSKYDDECSK